MTLIPRMCLRVAPDTTVARVGLGATFYLSNPIPWKDGGATAAYRAFLDCVPPAWLAWYTTSVLDGWRSLGTREAAMLADPLSVPFLGQVRHGFRFRAVDDPGAPACGFDYQEVDPRRESAAGVLEITAPQDTDPGVFRALVMRIAEAGPFWSGVAGYAARWNEREKTTAFWQIWRWCRRYIGLDVQDPNAIAWHAAEGLPGTNWLTLIGAPLVRARSWPVEELLARRWEPPVRVGQLHNGFVVQAGDAPTLGDVNRLELVNAYAAAARALDPFLIADFPRYWGGFYTEGETERWLRRFLAPGGWQ